MAVEVRHQRFLFCPKKPANPKPRPSGAVRPIGPRVHVKPATKIPVLDDQTGGRFTWFYNPLHDMEC